MAPCADGTRNRFNADMGSDLVRRRLVVVGKVQGVFFRDSTRQAARAVRVAGYAVNRDDGSVEIVLEGGSDAVESVISFCKTGPDRAMVRSVVVTTEQPVGLDGFRIC